MIAAMEARTKPTGFAGLRVLSLESRRAAEMAKLIETYGGAAIVAPSMREIPLESNTEAQAFTRELLADGFDMVIFLDRGWHASTRPRGRNGVHARRICRGVATRPVVARGPKPVAALKELGCAVTVAVPEPNTWRELLAALDERAARCRCKANASPCRSTALPTRNYWPGLPSAAHRSRKFQFTSGRCQKIPQPLRNAVTALARNDVDVALFTTSIQVIHLLKIAAEMNLQDAVGQAFARILVGSIGPVTSEELRAHGISVDFEPSHPKMGFLVNEVAQRSAELLTLKRQSAASI